MGISLLSKATSGVLRAAGRCFFSSTGSGTHPCSGAVRLDCDGGGF